MTSKNEARLKMYQSVADFLSKNTSITEPLPNFAILSSKLEGNIAGLLLLIQEQSGDQSGITLTKNKGREEIIIHAATLSGKLVAYATLIENDILLQSVRMTRSTMMAKSDHQLAGLCLSLCDEATSMLPELQAYAVTEEEITALRKLCTDFLIIIPKPRESIRDSRQLTLEQNRIMQETEKVLQKMDALLLIIRSTNSALYEHYRSSRKIMDNSSRSQTLRGLVKDARSKAGISRAVVTLEPENGNGKSSTEPLKILKKTAAKGGFAIPSMETGTYLVTAGKEGYETGSLTVYITHGELSRVNLELNPI
jgi:hypothetical protein